MHDSPDGHTVPPANPDVTFPSELRSLVSGVNLVVLLIAIAAATWGAFDSMTDAGDERFWGNLTLAAPGVYAGWCMLEPAVRRSTNVGLVLMRLMSACLIAPALVSIPVGVILAVAVILPGVRDTISSAAENNGGFHYYWSEGIGAQLALVPLGGWVVGACVALAVCLILSLPILSLRAPDVVASGSHIEKVESSKRDSTSALVFCGLGATVLGIVLWVFSDEGGILDFPRVLGSFLDTLSYGIVYWDEAAWLCGVVLVVLGVLAMGWGCVRVLIGRSATSRS